MATPPEEDRATATDNMQKLGENRMCSSRDMLADRQTDRHTDTITTILRSPIGGGATNILYLRNSTRQLFEYPVVTNIRRCNTITGVSKKYLGL